MISNQNMDFKQLREILKNKNILKVIHSARQDIEVLLYSFNLIVWPIFDTQLAYLLAYNENNIGYTNLVEKLFKIKLSKKYQQSNWEMRPLSKSQIDYAENDVKFLPKIHEIILREIRKKRKIKKLNIEINKLKAIENIFDIKNAYKRIKTKKLSIKELKILKLIAEWREELAQKINIPRNWVVSDKLIIQVIKKKNLKLITKNNKNRNLNSRVKDFNKFLEINKLI
jgi:ribonuclease D